MKVAIYPDHKIINPYIKIQSEHIKTFAEVTHFKSGKDILKLGKRLPARQFDAIIINWLENKALKEGEISLTSILKFFTYSIILRLATKRLIFVKHNYYSHSSTGLSRFISKCCILYLERLSSHTVAHSPHIKNSFFIPHPLYGGKMEVDKKLDYYLFFGRLMGGIKKQTKYLYLNL
jgi:hypothetical protein